MPLDVRRRLRRVAARERAELRRRHRERARCWNSRYSTPIAARPSNERGAPVQRDRVLDLVDRADLQMVVQVRADAGQVAHDAECRAPRAARRARCPRAAGSAASRSSQPRAAPRGARARAAAPPRRRRHAGRDASRPSRGSISTRSTSAPVRTLEVRAAERRAQERLRRAPAPAAALVHLEVGVAEIVAAIELGDLRDPALLGGIAPRVEDLPAHAPFLDAQLAARAVKLVGAVLVVLGALEHRQHVVPRPAAQPERRPVVVVGPLTAHVDHRVDRRAAAEHLAARVADRAAVQARRPARCDSTNRCAGCRSCTDSRPGHRSRSSRPCRRPRAAARSCSDRPTADSRARSPRCPRRR